MKVNYEGCFCEHEYKILLANIAFLFSNGPWDVPKKQKQKNKNTGVASSLLFFVCLCNESYFFFLVVLRKRLLKGIALRTKGREVQGFRWWVCNRILYIPPSVQKRGGMTRSPVVHVEESLRNLIGVRTWREHDGGHLWEGFGQRWGKIM